MVAILGIGALRHSLLSVLGSPQSQQLTTRLELQARVAVGWAEVEQPLVGQVSEAEQEVKCPGLGTGAGIQAMLPTGLYAVIFTSPCV